MLIVATAGAVVNLLAFRILSPGSGGSLNMAGAARHVLADLAGSVGAMVAAIIILTTGYDRADPIIGALIAVLVAASAVPIIRDSLRILLEAAPAGLDASEIGEAMARWPGVDSVHDLHVWTITSGFPALSAHVVVGADEDCHARRAELEAHARRALRPRAHDAADRPRRAAGAAAGQRAGRGAGLRQPAPASAG